MNILDQFGNYIYNKLNIRYKSNTIPKPLALTSDQRSSTPTHDGFMPSRKLQEVPIDFAREWFETMEHLAAYNADVGYALDNIVQLANTPHEITFSDSVSDSQATEMRKFLKEEEKNWYAYSGGISSLKSDLLTQIVINGALSAEIIPDNKLSGIKQIVRVAPKYIVFVYNKETDNFEPYQISNSIGVQNDYMGMKKLNTRTYKYIALRRMFEGPYPLPPFIAAAESLLIQKDMISNLKFIMQKLGMLGFLSAEVNPPDQKTGENNEDYHNRLIDYLSNKIYPQLEKNLGKGMVAGFKGTHEFKLQGNNMNVQGAKDLVEIVQLMIFAGLKQDPNMLGRNFSTTETFGRVILQKMLSQIRGYQQVVDTFMSEVYYSALRYKGYSPGYVEVKSETPMVGDKVKEQTADKIKVTNVVTKRNEGIIDQTQAANELGYDNPAFEGPIYGNNVPKEEIPIETDPKAPENETETQEEIKRFEDIFRKNVTEYQYHTIDCHESNKDNLYSLQAAKFDNPTMQKFANDYFNQSFSKYQKGNKKITASVENVIGKMDNSIPLVQVQDRVYLEILINWDEQYLNKQIAVTENNVDRIYSHYRKDKTIFPNITQESNSKAKCSECDHEFDYLKINESGMGYVNCPECKNAVTQKDIYTKQSFASDFEIPEAVFDLDDFRAIEFAESFDTTYLGKFITDEDTRRKIYNHIEQGYINGDLPFGNNPGHIKQFQKDFKSMLDLQGWKIRRIIDTSVNNIRNDANIFYINQAKVDKYEIIEINDNLTCDYCKHMNGLEFQTETTVTKINNKVNTSPDNINEVSPFATSIKIDEFQQLDSQQLSSKGIQQPSYHPHCRGRVVAVI